MRAALSASVRAGDSGHQGSRSLSAALAAGLGFGGVSTAVVAPAPPVSPMDAGVGEGSGRIVELSVGLPPSFSSVSEGQGSTSPPQEEGGVEGQGSHMLSMSMPAKRKGEEGAAIPSSPSVSPAPAQPALQQTSVISRASSFGSSLSSSSFSSSSSLMASTPPPPPPEDGVAEEEGEEGDKPMPTPAPTAVAATAAPFSPPPPQPLQPQPPRPHGQGHHRAHAFSLGGHGSMEEYLASLAAEGQCLEIARDGVRRRGLRAVRGMEGHVLVVCQLASLPCLGYFLAPLRQVGWVDGRRGKAEGGDLSWVIEEDGPILIHIYIYIYTNVYVYHTQGATDSGISPNTSSNSIDAVAADDAPTLTPATSNGPPVVILISHTAEPGSAASSALATVLQGGQRPATQGASRRKGLRKVIEGLRRFGPIYLVEGDASTEEGLVYVLFAYCYPTVILTCG